MTIVRENKGMKMHAKYLQITNAHMPYIIYFIYLYGIHK